MDEAALKQLIKQIINDQFNQTMLIPIGVSNRHLHIKEADFKQLFPNEEISVYKWLKQPGEFAANQTVTIIGKKGKIDKVRILGPFRDVTQLEVSKTDARTLGINPPLRMSGDIAQTPGITLSTPSGELTLDQGVIIAKRHIHIPSELAKSFQVEHGEAVSVSVLAKDRALTFDDVVIRVSDKFALEMHIDTDEANASNVDAQTMAKIVK